MNPAIIRWGGGWADSTRSLEEGIIMKHIANLSGQFVLACMLFALTQAGSVFAASPYFKDVCASGCAFSDLQSAINSITDSGPDKVYTILIDSGILSSDTSASTSGKSYINIIGRGIGTSVLRASAAWFQNSANGTTSPNFLDLTASTNLTLRDLTIDARSQDPGNL